MKLSDLTASEEDEECMNCINILSKSEQCAKAFICILNLWEKRVEEDLDIVSITDDIEVDADIFKIHTCFHLVVYILLGILSSPTASLNFVKVIFK